MEAELTNLSLKLGGKRFPTLNAYDSSSSSISSYNDLIKAKKNLRVAIIVPYRDRRKNLNIFLLYMHRFLAKQNIQYGIYLIEPAKDLKFNRALLLNIGFVESLKDDEWDCFIFHDVDMLPENNENLYQCDRKYPKQLAISLNTYFYT
jgi:hypothetical protein